MGPLNIELTLDPHVYLHEAELIFYRGMNARMVPFGLKDAHSAVWRQLWNDDGAQAPLSFSIAWRAIATDKPGIAYGATITVRDVRCERLETFPSTENPSRWRGQIGPADNPTDVGQVAIKVSAGSLGDNPGAQGAMEKSQSCKNGLVEQTIAEEDLQ